MLCNQSSVKNYFCSFSAETFNAEPKVVKSCNSLGTINFVAFPLATSFNASKAFNFKAASLILALLIIVKLSAYAC